MRAHNFLILISLFSMLPVVVFSDTATQKNGTDNFLGGDAVTATLTGPGDTFAAGRTTRLRGQTNGDIHVSGYDVTVSTDTSADLYAAGASVTIEADVGEDLSVFGYSIKSLGGGNVAGNARFFGSEILVEAPVGGSLTALGRSVTIDTAIEGDVWVAGKTLSFGENAKISGSLKYMTDTQIDIPAAVIDPARVDYEKPNFASWDEFHKGWVKDDEWLPGRGDIIGSFVVVLAFFMVIGALFLAFLPKPVERMRNVINSQPWNTLLIGVLGLSVLFGLVPITGLTIVGIPLLPFLFLAIIVLWTLGYLLGGYSVAMWLWNAFGGEEPQKIISKLLVLAAAITAIAILNFIPFIGWLVNYALVLLGLGAMTNLLMNWWIGMPLFALNVDLEKEERD